MCPDTGVLPVRNYIPPCWFQRRHRLILADGFLEAVRGQFLEKLLIAEGDVVQG